MNKNGGKIVLWGLIIAMLVFTSTRTIDFLKMTFPVDQQYIAWLGLAAFDVGVLGWFYYATHSARGDKQRAVAYGMIFVCMAGVLATTIADMVIVSAQNGVTKLPAQWGTLGLWAVIIVICLNFVAGILVHLVDPKHLQTMKEESLRDDIINATHLQMDRQKDLIAPQIAQGLAQHWAQQITAEMIGKLPGQNGQTVNSTLAPVTMSQIAPAPVAPVQHATQTQLPNSQRRSGKQANQGNQDAV